MQSFYKYYQASDSTLPVEISYYNIGDKKSIKMTIKEKHYLHFTEAATTWINTLYPNTRAIRNDEHLQVYKHYKTILNRTKRKQPNNQLNTLLRYLNKAITHYESRNS